MRLFFRIFLASVVLVGVFFLGFFCGFSRRPPDIAPAVPSSVVSVEPELNESELSEEERRIAEALSDPDFKRVHDHLMRENPVEMNIPALPTGDENKVSEPRTERAPVRFVLP